MKTKIKIAFPIIVVFVLCAAALSPSIKPLVPYEHEQTKGNIRVVLLKTERVTIFNSDGITNAEKGKVYPVPYCGVTFLVEALGKEPIERWYSDDVNLNLIQQLPKNLAAGAYYADFDIGTFGSGAVEIPKFEDKKRCVISQCLYRASSPNSDKLKITINAGINKKTETFVFDDVPVNF
jgi:hypothetical protein